METLQEKWYTFKRFHCKTGCIDYWRGDCINDPNNKVKNGQLLNSSALYFRLNDGKWFHERDFEYLFLVDLHQLYKGFDAEEIFNEYKL